MQSDQSFESSTLFRFHWKFTLRKGWCCCFDTLCLLCLAFSLHDLCHLLGFTIFASASNTPFCISGILWYFFYSSIVRDLFYNQIYVKKIIFLHREPIYSIISLVAWSLVLLSWGSTFANDGCLGRIQFSTHRLLRFSSFSWCRFVGYRCCGSASRGV